MRERNVIKLQYPIKKFLPDSNDEVEISVLYLQRMKMKHMKLIPDSIFEKKGKEMSPDEMMPIIAALTGEDVETIGEIDIVDMNNVVERVTEYFAKSMEGGTGNGGQQSG